MPDSEEIIRRSPVNKPAALVTGKGTHYTSKKKICQDHWSVPPPMRPPSPDTPKLVGVRFGQLTVMGRHRHKSGYWVVRCDCGSYETRRTKSVLNPANGADRCDECRHLAYLRRHDEFRRTGKNLDSPI